MPTNQERLPAPPLSELTALQKQAAAELVSGPRGALIGPFGPLLHSPELMTAVQKTGEYLRFRSTLDRRLFEMCVLLVARHWSQQFEWGFHRPLALAAGLDAAIVDAISQARRPPRMDSAASALWDLVDDLQQTRSVADDHFVAAVTAFGKQGVVEIVTAVGYYTTLAMVMNTAQTPPPTGTAHLETVVAGPDVDIVPTVDSDP